MIEHASAPKKKQVGSLFFHLFHRLSVWIYTLLCNCFIARLLTSYEVLELRWSKLCTRILGAPDGKLRHRMHLIRLRIAGALEHSRLLRMMDGLVRFLTYCPLNVYGIYFLSYGAVSAAVYFVGTRLSVTYAGNIGWGISGLIIAVFSLPLLCSGKPLYRAAFGSRIVGRFLRSYLGLEPSQKGKESKERFGTWLVYIALLLGVASGALTLFYHPFSAPIALLLIAAVLTVLYIPEAGVLLALGTLSFWWITGQPALCAAGIAIVTHVSFINKLLRGKRVLHVRLLDFVVILLGLVFASHGIFTQGGVASLYYGIGYTLLIAMYFPTVNLIRSAEWLRRCYALLSLSGAMLSVISLLPFAQIFHFMDLVIERVDLTMMSELFANYEKYFGQHTLIGGMLLMLLPIMLSGLAGKRSVTGFFWKAVWILVGCLSVVATMQLGAWAGLGVALLVFFFTYSYRSLSAAMLLAFPVACGAVWYTELKRLFDTRMTETVQAMLDVIVHWCDGFAGRQALAQSVVQMSLDHMLGVGFGEHAVQAVFPHYAASGMESVIDMGNVYLQMLAECGYLALLLLFAVMVLFVICVLTFLRWGTNQTAKARVAAGFAGVAGVLVMGWTYNFLGSASVFALFWLIFSLTIASIRTQYDTFARAVQTHSGTKERTDIAFRSR